MPDFEAMTQEERHRWLEERNSTKLPREARPILVAVIASFVWFMVLSPLVAAPWGSNLDPDPVDSGTATVTTCQRSWTSLWRMSTCQAQIVWEGHETTTDVVVHSPRDLEPGVYDVVARGTRSGSRPSLMDFDRMTVVPADMPANTGVSVVQLTALNVGAVVVIWGIAIAAVTWDARRASARTSPEALRRMEERRRRRRRR